MRYGLGPRMTDEPERKQHSDYSGMAFTLPYEKAAMKKKGDSPSFLIVVSDKFCYRTH
jgi:hypothetical protein